MALRSNNPYAQHLPLIALDDDPKPTSPSAGSAPNGSSTTASPKESPLQEKSPFSTSSSSPGYNQFSGPTLFQPYKPKPYDVPPPAPSVPPQDVSRKPPRTLLQYQNSLRGQPTSPDAAHLGGLAGAAPIQAITIPRPPSILNPDPIPSQYRPSRRFPAIGETIAEDDNREQVMRGNYTENTAPLSYPGEEPTNFRPMSALSGMNAKLQQAEDMLRKSRLNHVQHPRYQPNLKFEMHPIAESPVKKKDEKELLAEIYPQLSTDSITAIQTFAAYLTEDTAMADRSQGQDESRRSALDISRLHRWNVWRDAQDKERRKLVGIEDKDDDTYSESSAADSQLREESPQTPSRNPFHEDERRTIKDLLSGSEEDRPGNQAPSPTPTDIQVAAAPKVDLILQMPRPMPGVPASRLDPSSRDYKGGAHDIHPEIDTGVLAEAVRIFASKSSKDETPALLRQAWTALDTACNNPSLESFLADARRILQAKQNATKAKFTSEIQARNAHNQAQLQTLISTNRATPAELQRIRNDLEKDDTRRQLDHQQELYTLFEHSFVEVAYKEVKAQLEVLAGKWYEDVKHWLLHAVSASDPTATTDAEYRLFLDCLDLLNKFNAAIEDHERVLQNLVSERNARYLEVSVAPLHALGDNARSLEAERRFWIDEQERLLVTKNEAVKRARDYASVSERISMDIIDRLKKRFESLVAEVNKVVLQFPSPVLPELFRRFFDYDSKDKVIVSTAGEGFTVPAHVIASLGDSVQVLSLIVNLIKRALDLSQDPQVKLANANFDLQVAEDYARMHALSSPTAMAAACAATLAARQPVLNKRLTEEQAQRAGLVQDDLLDVLRKLRAMIAELHKDPHLPAVEVRSNHDADNNDWRQTFSPETSTPQAQSYSQSNSAQAQSYRESNSAQAQSYRESHSAQSQSYSNPPQSQQYSNSTQPQQPYSGSNSAQSQSYISNNNWNA